jgi:hypothetical protein
MRNPWRARNPWLSLWLSGANAMFGAARAQAQRNANRMAADNVTRAVNAWSAALLPQPAKPARKRAKR